MAGIILDRFPSKSLTLALRKLKTISDLEPKIIVKTVQSEPLDIANIGVQTFIDRDICRGILDDAAWVLSREDILEASKFEGLASNVISRYNLYQKNFTSTEVTSHYYRLFNFWVEKIKKNEISCCLHYYIPHDPSSFVLHLVCKYLGIASVYIDVPHVFNRFRFVSCSFQNRTLLLEGENGGWSVGNELLKYQQEYLKDAVNTAPLSTRWRVQRPSKKDTAIRLLTLIFRLRLIKNNYKMRSSTFFKISRYSWKKKESDFTGLTYFLFLVRLRIRLNWEKLKYHRKCTPVKREKFVYFAMSAQPEASSLPAALALSNIFTCLKMLRQGLPNEVKIYFKENPSVFETRNPYISGTKYRSKSYYEELAEIEGLQFVRVDQDSSELIRNSLAVATINGTSAIEAISSQKTAFIFGSNWYEELPRVVKVDSSDQIKLEIQKIEQEKYTDDDIRDIYFDRGCMIEFSDHLPYEFSEESNEEAINALFYGLEKFHKIDHRKWQV